MALAQTKPQRDPDLPGLAPAWKITLPQDALDAADAAGVGESWLLHSPGSHPFWDWHFLAMVHLRDMPGQTQPPVRHSPEMTHEIMCFAIDPDKPLPDPDYWYIRESPGILLTPPDFVVQFQVGSDEQAEGVLDAVMRTAVSGVSVDSDLRTWWDTSIKATAQHYLEGKHE